MNALVALIGDIRAARTRGATDAQLGLARDSQRKGQFLLDFIEAENSMGSHAGQQAARIRARSIDFTRQGQIAVRDAMSAR